MRFITFVAVLSFTILTACSNIPSDLQDRVKALSAQVTQMQELLGSQEQAYEAVQASDDWGFFAPYAEREDWAARFTIAQSEITQLATIKSEAEAMVDRDNESDIPALNQLLERFQTARDKAREAIMYVRDRRQLLQDGVDNAETWFSESRERISAIEGFFVQGESFVSEAQNKFTNRSDDIALRWAPYLDRKAAVLSAMQVVQTQYNFHASSSADVDYAMLADSFTSITSEHDLLSAQIPEFGEELAELSAEYIKILTDMRVTYHVQIGRSSWNSGVDGGGRDRTYHLVEVPEETFSYLIGLPQGERNGYQDNIAAYSTGWGGKMTVHIEQSHWDALNVNVAADWPSRHNSSSFWIADTDIQYWHRYDIIENGVVSDSGWVSLNEELDNEADAPEEFALYAAALGMTIESKPYGKFEDESIIEPTPPGMDLVGNDRYGEYRTDASGNSFWHYYGQYALFRDLIGGPGYYTRDDRSNWAAHRSQQNRDWGYYGRDRNTPVYGSAGSTVRNSNRFAQSTYVQSGSYTRADATIRNAGQAARTRGPRGTK